MGTMIVKEIRNISEREIEAIDEFILNENTNGEFINSLKYLGYHPKGRFNDRSILAVDQGSGEIRGCLLAAEEPGNPRRVISHPGTTFAGIIVNRKLSIKNMEEVVDTIMEYYEEKYESVVARLRPDFFAAQPFGGLSYFLLKRGYCYCMTGLSNVIDISGIRDENDIFALYDSAKRNQVRKVLRSGQFTFDNRNEIRRDVWINMNQVLAEKHHTHSTHTYEEMCELMDRVPDCISAYHADHINGEYGAFALIYRFKDVFHTQYLDTNYQYTGQYPNLLLIHNLIQIAREEGYSKFSFGVSTENRGKVLNYGLYNYKAGYGGGSILLGEYEWTRRK